MRLIEILIILAPLPYFVWPVFSTRFRPPWIALSPLIGLILLPIQLLVEGYRWQMVPAYLLTILLSILVIWQWQRKPEGETTENTRNQFRPKLAAFFGIILILFTAVLPAALPIPKQSPPSGPYDVGTKTFYWVDESRQEKFGPSPGGPRELMVQLWYPAEIEPVAEYALWNPDIEVIGPALANWLGLPSFLLDHLAYARTNSVAQAPLSQDQSRYRVLIFSHGLGGVRMQNTFQMEELASQGFVVASIDHTYGGAATVFPDGRIALFDLAAVEGDIETAGNRLIETWTEDGRFVLDQLEQLNEADPDNTFTGHLYLTQIGYFGHSTGGGTAFRFCQLDQRCGAGVALDGWLSPIHQEIETSPMTKPFLFLKAEDWSTPENSAAIQAADNFRQSPGSIITLPGTRHYNFTDIPLLSPLTPQMGLTGSANGRETLARINEYTSDFFKNYLPN